ncbi:alcohol dehydrogenase [Caballeronia mineralivorans PML1(12)]|uniref:Alcohol dehydrogenase n=2 Tax=Burkholderiaceae TaxID=119060 RepID=A0A0J1CX89_9BURK|nr:alcohol dehydrogenase [Caballeronia mineralivorans PML1(12)]
MPQQITAAIVRTAGGALTLEQLTLGDPQPHEVVVKIVATGVCHTDMVIRDQLFTTPLPLVLGHEGAGIVEAVGSEVTRVVPGDHVVMTYMSCGHCDTCVSGHPAYCENMAPLNFGGAREDGTSGLCDCAGHSVHGHFFGQSSFSTYALASDRNVIKVPKDIPLELLAPLGCGIQTGAGAVLNSLKVSAGSSFAAFGTGAVGLAAIMAARVAGATTIIAVDIVPNRLELALQLGATHTVNPKLANPVEAIREFTGGGANFTLECSGRPEVLRQAVDSLSIFGTCGIVGATKIGTEVSLNINDVMIPSRRIMGIVQGDALSHRFIPTLIELYRQGRFPFDRLIKQYRFDQVNEAMKDSESGATIKPVLMFEGQ